MRAGCSAGAEPGAVGTDGSPRAPGSPAELRDGHLQQELGVAEQGDQGRCPMAAVVLSHCSLQGEP